MRLQFCCGTDAPPVRERYLIRHQSGDWGEIDTHDRKENQLSLEQGFRLISVYTLSITGVKIWVITEADRSSTCILLTEEY